MNEKFEGIFAYTRRMAFKDGHLVDVTETAKEVGFIWPVAMTRAVWCEYVEAAGKVDGEDERARLWSILTMARFAVRQTKTGFEKDTTNALQPLVKLKAVCGRVIEDGPCLTIMTLDEN